MSTGDTTLASLGGRGNSIGFLRLVAAFAVLFGHSFPNGGYGQDPFLTLTGNQVAPGRVAVDVFFLLSGFLIAASWVNLASPGVFLWHRFLRIYPAYWVCILITGLVLAPALGAGVDIGYVLRNLLLVVGNDRTVDGLAWDGGVVNAALWTLPWELRAYLLVVLLGAFGLLRRPVVVAGMLVGAWALLVVGIYSFPGEATSAAVTSGVRLLTFFLAGVLAYQLGEHIRLDRRWFVVAVTVTLAATVLGAGMGYSGGLFYVVAPIPVTYATLYLAVRLPCQRINTARDLSYGTYIYGTLAIHVVHQLMPGTPWVVFFAVVSAVTVTAAAASWYLVEQPALRLKRLRLGQVVAKVIPSSDTHDGAVGVCMDTAPAASTRTPPVDVVELP